MKLEAGQVYSPKQDPTVTWVVLEVKERTFRAAFLSVNEGISSGPRPGTEFEIELHAVNHDGLTRIA